MAQGIAGLSAATSTRLVLGPGQMYANIDATALEDGSATDPWGDAIAASGATLLGSTRGGASFNRQVEYRDAEVDGLLGPTKGLKHRTSVAPILSADFLEFDYTQLLLYAGGSDGETAGLYHKITFGSIEDADYLDNVALGCTIQGSDVAMVILLQNVIGMLEAIALEDDNEATATTTWMSHFLDTAPNTEPVIIYVPGTLA